MKYINITYLDVIMFTNLWHLILIAASSFSASVIQHAGDPCSEEQWKCDDGSCSSIVGQWDGIIKCQNNSVPPHTPRRETRQAQNGTCVLPEYPANGTYTSQIPNAKPRDAYDSVTINVTCDQGFKLSGSATSHCNKGLWSKPMPKCVAQCYLPSHPSVIYRCPVSGRDDSSRACGTSEIDGTLVSPQCRRPYYYSAVSLTHMLCIDGNWNYTAKCSQECGEVPSTGTPLVISGAPAKRSEVPWHAGIYTTTSRPYMQICGGSLISNNIVLSAAHCFWDNFESKQLPAEEFAVAVGKLYRPWSDDVDDAHAQRSNVSALHLPHLFQDSTANFQEDIAVVVTTTLFEFTTFVRPICVDFDYSLHNAQLAIGNMGKVAGWGLKDVTGAPSQVLQIVDLPVVNTTACLEEAPLDFRGYITADKICAGFKNESKGVCKGDSGGGLAFPKYDDSGAPRFYIRGIVSTAPAGNQLCNVNFYTTFTQILSHERFIKQFWKTRAPCQLKPHPSVEYRCQSFGHNESYRPCNEYEVADTVVSPRCRSPDYNSATALSLMNCVEGSWNYIATCAQVTEAKCSPPSGTCKSIYECPSMLEIVLKNDKTRQDLDLLRNSKCGFQGNIPKVCCPDQCSTPDGQLGTCTRIDSCSHIAILLQPPISRENIQYVQNSTCTGAEQVVCCGPPPERNCAAAVSAFPPDPSTGCCGVDIDVGNEIVGSNATRLEHYPWLAIIEYIPQGGRRDLCRGVLISGQYVLTSAYCLIDDAVILRPKSVHLGVRDVKNCGPLAPTRKKCPDDDERYIVVIPIELGIPHPDYDSPANNLGLIRLTERAPFTDFIRPICLPSVDVKLNAPNNFILLAGGLDALDVLPLGVDVPFVDNVQCEGVYKTIHYNVNPGTGQLCAGRTNGSCSGGLLTIKNVNTYEVVGVHSTGPPTCGSTFPDLYTNVFQYLAWIRTNIVA